ncbi:hypothetical protein OPKNFCMD_1251 [Methylobacterium crusticola]|uniref:Glycosyltransferase n=1 Tax=Methylobacterium crusticola TaxID=1697972 RepID=A0ABQ4QV19_9HYPH|nr:glycosyltransferase [Methylobacterium crusticola]GJD48529.1 hypothetical protein OPKNFCMD_1251 [Methylobacterium crusticola]
MQDPRPDLDGQRVRTANAPEIWLVYGGRRHHVTTYEVYESLFGEADHIVDVETATIPVGPALGPGSGLIRAAGSDAIYLLARGVDGRALRHHVVDHDQLLAFRFRHDRITALPADALDRIPPGGPLGASRAERADADARALTGLAESLNPDRPTLLVVLDAPTAFAAAHAGHLQQSAARQVNALVGRVRGNILALSHGPDLAGAASVWLPLAEGAVARAAARLGIARLDILAASPEHDVAPAVRAAFSCPYDVTCLDHPGAGAAPSGLSEAVARADRLIACNEATAARLRDLLPGRAIHLGLDPEPSRPQAFRVHPARIDDDDPLRVLILGPLAPPARALVSRAAQTARAERRPVRFYWVGDDLLAAEGREPAAGCRELAAEGRDLTRLGPLAGLDLNLLVCTLRPHVAWFPLHPTDPYDALLSRAMLQGLPILASDSGAYPERLAGRAYSWILPAGTGAEAWVAFMLRLRETGLRLPDPAGPRERVPSFYPRAYLAWAAPEGEADPGARSPARAPGSSAREPACGS